LTNLKVRAAKVGYQWSMHLKKRVLTAFALISLPLAMGGLPLGIYLVPYYAGELGISLAAIGIIVLLTRVTDVATDPLIGTLSDATPARFGRRGIWIMIGLPVMGFATLAVFNPPEQVGHLYLFFSVAFLYLGWTLISIPLSAWAAELSPDYHERSRITGARSFASSTGLLLVMSLPLLMAFLVGQGYTCLTPEHPGSLQPMLKIVAWCTLAGLCVFGPLLVFSVPQATFVQKNSMSFRQALTLVWNNKPFMRLLAAGVTNHVGWYCISTLYVFFLAHYLKATTQQWSALLIVYFVFGMIGTPLIVRLASKINKHKLMATLSMYMIAVYSTVLLMEPGQWKYYILIQIFCGLVANIGNVLVPSMAADVIDKDTVESGQQRGALFMALWGTADKIALAVAAGLTLPFLQFLGFDPSVENDLQGLKALQYTYTLVPIFFLTWSAWLIWRFPITKEYQEELRARISSQQLRVDS
jgi:Na+/melibiose symporter-like transporter|tara:strand:+ start:1101 stop:2513 length:1413 start_codon:yes stop_codon:yes gene_type:complete